MGSPFFSCGINFVFLFQCGIPKGRFLFQAKRFKYKKMESKEIRNKDKIKEIEEHFGIQLSRVLQEKRFSDNH